MRRSPRLKDRTVALGYRQFRGVGVDGASPSERFGVQPVCGRYRRWAAALKPSMRQVHRAGEKLFVDFSGKRRT
jgi:hypothetical protein